MIYSIATCPKCGIIQTIQINSMEKAVLRCVSCNQQTKIKKADGRIVKLHGFYDHPSLASKVCAELKKELAEKKEDDFRF